MYSSVENASLMCPESESRLETPTGERRVGTGKEGDFFPSFFLCEKR